MQQLMALVGGAGEKIFNFFFIKMSYKAQKTTCLFSFYQTQIWIYPYFFFVFFKLRWRIQEGAQTPTIRTTSIDKIGIFQLRWPHREGFK